jgi:DNA polymerase III epsilon subunit-like protein
LRYVSLDLETSGSDPLRHQVLELAAVVEDTRRTATTPLAELPSFRRALRHPELTGTAGALALNARLLEELADKSKADAPDICTPAEVLPQLRAFLLANGFKADAKDRVSFTIAGKNIGVFDIPFLRQLPGWGTIIRAEPAVLDPASFYLNWHKDSRLPSMLICQARSGMPEPHVAHEALADALEVVRLLRPFYERPFYKEVLAGEQ